MVYFVENPFKKMDDLGVRLVQMQKAPLGADLRTFQKSGLEPIPIDSIGQPCPGHLVPPGPHFVISPHCLTSPPMFFHRQTRPKWPPWLLPFIGSPKCWERPGHGMPWLDAFYMNKRPNMEKNRGFL